TGTHPALDHDRVVAHTAGLGQRRPLERQHVRDVVQAALGHAHELRHGPVRPVAEARALRAEVVFAGPAIEAAPADGGGGLGDDAVALLEAAHAGADARDRPPELVAEHDGHVHRPALLVVVLVHVAAADAHGTDAQEDVLFPELRHGQLAQLDGQRLQGVLDEARHHLGHARILRVISLSSPLRSPSATWNASALTVRGAPRTTKGAPRRGIEIASSMVRPPTAWTGMRTARTTPSSSSSGLRRPRPAAAAPFLSSKPVWWTM